MKHFKIFRESCVAIFASLGWGHAICYLKRHLCVVFQGKLLFSGSEWNLTRRNNATRKEEERKSKGAPLPLVPILQKFLKTHEKHCAQTQVSVHPAITKDLKSSINNEQILRKVSDVLLSSFFSEMNWRRFTPKEPGPSVPVSPEVAVSLPLCSCLKSKARLWHQGPAQHF